MCSKEFIIISCNDKTLADALFDVIANTLSDKDIGTYNLENIDKDMLLVEVGSVKDEAV